MLYFLLKLYYNFADIYTACIDVFPILEEIYCLSEISVEENHRRWFATRARIYAAVNSAHNKYDEFNAFTSCCRSFGPLHLVDKQILYLFSKHLISITEILLARFSWK